MRGADDRHRGARDRRSASSCCCSRRCRWCAASACCSWPASRSRFFLALTAGTAALVAARAAARGAPARSARSARGAAELVDELRPRARRASRAPLRRRRRARVARRCCAARSSGPRRVLADRARARAGRAGGRLADAGSVRPARARAAGPARRARPRRAAAARPAWRGRSTSSSRARDLTDPAVVRVDARLPGRRCSSATATRPRTAAARPTLCPALSLPDLFRSAERGRRSAGVRALLDAVPPYFSQAVITADRKTATLAFGDPADAARRASSSVIDEMRGAARPAGGRDARGSPACRCSPPRRTPRCPRRCGGSATLLAGLLAVGLVLLRGLPPLGARVGAARADRARDRLVGARAVRCCGVPLNPMSATLGALVIAISTEFTVLLSARYREERAAGHEPARGAAAHLPLDRRGGARLRRRPRSRASRCSRSPTSRCSATSGASPSST